MFAGMTVLRDCMLNFSYSPCTGQAWFTMMPLKLDIKVYHFKTDYFSVVFYKSTALKTVGVIIKNYWELRFKSFKWKELEGHCVFCPTS